jgi:hypothetical protein
VNRPRFLQSAIRFGLDLPLAMRSTIGLLAISAGLLGATGCDSAHSEAAKTAEQDAATAPPALTIQVVKPVWRKVQRTAQGHLTWLPADGRNQMLLGEGGP